MTDRYTKDTRACIVRENISRGFGVEDISVRYGIPVSGVRYEVKMLREAGAFKYMFPIEPRLENPP